MKFAKIDVARYPEMAEEYGISTSPMARQMPTLILFQKGKEKTRLPPFNKEGKVVRTIMEKVGTIQRVVYVAAYSVCRKE